MTTAPPKIPMPSRWDSYWDFNTMAGMRKERGGGYVTFKDYMKTHNLAEQLYRTIGDLQEQIVALQKDNT